MSWLYSPLLPGAAQQQSAAADEGVGSAAGVATVTAVGISDAASAGAVAGVATATGVSAADASSVGAAAGVATVEAVGDFDAATDEGAGTAAGTSTATAVGASDVAAVGSASGSATVEGFGFGEIQGQAQQGGASYLTQEEYEAALARARKLENARKDIKRRDRDKWARIMGRSPEPEAAPEPHSAPAAAGKHKPLAIAPIPAIAAPDPRLAAIAAELKAVKAKLEEHRAAEAQEDDDIEALLILAA